jgi:ABC-type amino acid transport substrate-binding protein
MWAWISSSSSAFAAEEAIGLEILSLDFGALIPALAAGKVDIITDGLAITAERRKAVDFSIALRPGAARWPWPSIRQPGEAEG